MTATQISRNVQTLFDLIEQRELSDEQAEATASFLADLLEAAKMNKLTDVDRDEFRSNLDLDRILSEPNLTSLSGVHLPPHSVSIQQRVEDGRYNWANSGINGQRFSITLDAGPADLWLAHFNIVMQTEEVEAWAAAKGYEVAFVEEVLSVGAHPDHGKLQLQFPIIALGSSTVVDGTPNVPYLSRNGSKRRLNLDYRGSEWGEDCRFLLRKVSSPLAT